MSIPTGCPFHARSLPGDGTPLKPSPRLAQWRDEAAFMPLDFQDGHEGLVATRYDAAVSVLQDRRFSMRPSRMPVGPDSPTAEGEAGDAGSHGEHAHAATADAEAVPLELPGDLDEAVSGLLTDGLAASDVNGNTVPSGFSRVDAFRTGVLGGEAACSGRYR